MTANDGDDAAAADLSVTARPRVATYAPSRIAHVVAPKGSVVIPTRNRPDLLATCLRGLAENSWCSEVEVIVIDDGSDVPLDPNVAPDGLHVVFARCDGVGPGAARNEGIALARGDIVLFTDDDTVPCKGWIEAAIRFLEDHSDCIGVDGPVRSRRWDPLTEASMETDAPDHHWTCNVAYRRQTLLELGGFRSDVFRFAHGEDRDLGLRALSYGGIGFASGMAIVHTPRKIALKDVYRGARWARDDVILYALHPHLVRDFSRSPRIGLILGAITWWGRAAFGAGHRVGPRRFGRALLSCSVAAVVTAATVVSTPSSTRLRRRYDGTVGTMLTGSTQSRS
jgi:glycosyltransferase involved in cell wall biosynthesis